MFVITTVLLSVFVAVGSWRRKMSNREIAAVTGGYILVMIPLGVVPDEGAWIMLAALGGGITQWGFDAHRARTGRRAS